MFHFGWDRIEVWEYIVEFPDTDGQPVRLPIKEKTFMLRLPDVGGTVPVLVNGRRTKAAFDLKDPRTDAVAALKRVEKAREERDEARFEARLKGLDPLPEDADQ